MKHCVMGLVSLLLVGSLTGCGAVQVRDRAYVQSITLSAKESASEVALHLFTEPEASAQAYGDTISAALEQAQVQLGKFLFMGHLELLALENTSFLEKLSALRETHQLSPSCKVLLHLDEEDGLADADTELLLQMLQQEEAAGSLPETDLLAILMELAEEPKTALLPTLTTQGFGLAVCRPAEDPSLLSADSVAGLCWMRGKNLPKRLSVATEQGTVDCVLSSSAAKFTAVVAKDGTAAVTLQIQLTAEDAMSEETEAQLRKQIQRQCQSAWEETVFQLHADVFSLGALLNSQCHSYAVQTDWATICETATFSCQISIRS